MFIFSLIYPLKFFSWLWHTLESYIYYWSFFIYISIFKNCYVWAYLGSRTYEGFWGVRVVPSRDSKRCNEIQYEWKYNLSYLLKYLYARERDNLTRVRDATDRRPIVSTWTLRLWCPPSSLILTLFFDLTLVLSLSFCLPTFVLSLSVCRLSFSLFLSADVRSLSFCLPTFVLSLSVCFLDAFPSAFMAAPPGSWVGDHCSSAVRSSCRWFSASWIRCLLLCWLVIVVAMRLDIRRAWSMVGALLTWSFCWTSGLRSSGLYMNRHRMHFLSSWPYALAHWEPPLVTEYVGNIKWIHHTAEMVVMAMQLP